ncbi:MAG: NUDIX domain-containing protein [Clostridia bacterium]|nr:NUDIX domain-containing protein [Clostridia bacterium]
MIDHIAALIFNEEGELLVLRKKTVDNRKECILPGGKREQNESDEQTLRRELLEELGTEIKELNYYKQYLDKAIFEEGEDFRQTTYITRLESNNIEVRNEIKEALWIDLDYEEKGILCNPTLKLKIISDLKKDGFFRKRN